jgi:hypothetical protein
MKVDGSVATISIKNFPIGLHVMYSYFPDTPRITNSNSLKEEHVEKCNSETQHKNGHEYNIGDVLTVTTVCLNCKCHTLNYVGTYILITHY